MMSDKRKTEKKQKNAKENTMSYKEFDWNKMLNDGTLATQRVPVLNKYIEEHNLFSVKTKKKSEKVTAIIYSPQPTRAKTNKPPFTWKTWKMNPKKTFGMRNSTVPVKTLCWAK